MLSHKYTRKTARQWMGMVAVASIVIASGHAYAQSEQQELVNASETTFSNFMRDPDMTWLQRHIGRAKGVLIAPQIVKAGWIFGGSGVVPSCSRATSKRDAGADRRSITLAQRAWASRPAFRCPRP